MVIIHFGEPLIVLESIHGINGVGSDRRKYFLHAFEKDSLVLAGCINDDGE
jgi:hypothetical protein